MSGLHAAPAAIHHDGTQRGIQLGLTTAGARALLGVPAAELAGELLELEDVAPDLADLPERLAGLSPEEGLAVVARALTRALARNGEAAPRAEVGRALAGLTRGERVGEVADEVGYSRRRLGTLVREETGLAPKEYQRVARFEASRAELGHRPLAEVAASAGTPTRATSRGTGPSWPAAHRARGCARSSHSSKTTRSPARQSEAMTAQDTKLWHSMAFADADRMMEWLKAIGFTEHATYRDEADASVVVHAEWLWPGGGGIMFGSRRPDAAIDNVGGSAAYLITDDVDGTFERAVAAGATVAARPRRPGLRRARRQRQRIQRATTGPSGTTSLRERPATACNSVLRQLDGC